jgi:hypothetical protein
VAEKVGMIGSVTLSECGSSYRKLNKQMLIKTKLSILAAAVILCITSTAFADKLCLQTTVNRKTFKITNKSVVASICPKGYTELVDTSSFQGPVGATGPAGAQGPAGASGTGSFNPNLCTKREAYRIAPGAVYVEAGCQTSEILITGSCSSDAMNNQHIIREWKYFAYSDSNFPELYSGIGCRVEATVAGSHMVTAQALCCQPG